MTDIRLHLPIGPSGPNVSAVDLQAMQQNLTVSEFDGGSAPWRTYTFTDTPADSWKGVRFMYLGSYIFRTGNLELQLSGPTMAVLKQELGRDIPIPQRIICGPVIRREEILSAGYVTESETIVANLSEDSFTIKLRDQGGYYLDPIDYFQLFQQLGLWQIGQARCPLIPGADPSNESDIKIAGSTLVASNKPYMIVGGNIREINSSISRRIVVYNPPDPIPNYYQFISKRDNTTSYFSFTTYENLTVTIKNLPDTISPKLRVKHTNKNNSWETTSANHKWTFTLESKKTQLDLKHEEYRGYGYPKIDKETGEVIPRNGSRQPSNPLSYELRITWQDNGTKSLETTITQDIRDIIRQEYRFHSSIFQPDNIDLTKQTRSQVEYNTPPDFVEFYKEKKLVKSLSNLNNYHKQNWLLNVEEVYTVIEYMHRRFGIHLSQLRTTDPTIVPLSTTGDIRVTSSWRNPERNEAVGGVRQSNHQFGRALDLKSKHRQDAKLVNIPLNKAMFEAGQDFLATLVQLNPDANFNKVEILLERSTSLLWKCVYSNSNIVLKRGKEKVLKKVFKKKLGLASPPQDDEEALTKALQCATHVHIGWSPNKKAPAFTLPQPDPMPQLSGLPYRNIVLASAVDESLNNTSQPPLDFMARSIKKHLETTDPNTPTNIRVVHNPIEFLNYCNVFRNANYKVRYFFCLSYATSTHLELTRYKDDIPYQRPEGESGAQIHDQELIEDLDSLYSGSFEFDLEGNLIIGLTIGEDDYNQIQTHQMRVFNVNALEGSSREDARATFSESKGVYLISCQEDDTENGSNNEFAQAFANLIQRPVYGRIFNNEFLAKNEEGKWVPTNITRENSDDGIREEIQPDDPTIIPKPTSEGFNGILNLVNDDWGLSEVPTSDDLLDIYQNQNMLTRYDPQEDSDGTN